MIPPGPVIGFAAVPALLGLAQAVVGLGVTGWAAGLLASLVVNAALARGVRHRDGDALALGPANRVTLARAVLVCAVAAFVADRHGAASATEAIVVTSTVALSLDPVDGWVARRTGTVSALGARFDMEVDAFLILVLSSHVAAQMGWWVLGLGVWRYARWAAAGWAPWLQHHVASRRWRKAVAAAQGVVLVAVSAGALPGTLAVVTLAAALALLTVSFGTEIASLWRHRIETEQSTGASESRFADPITALPARAP